jgi:hypothetical protein
MEQVKQCNMVWENLMLELLRLKLIKHAGSFVTLIKQIEHQKSPPWEIRDSTREIYDSGESFTRFGEKGGKGLWVMNCGGL